MPSACFDAIRNVSTPGKHAEGESTEKVGGGRYCRFFADYIRALPTFNNRWERFFVAGGVRAFGGGAFAQVVDFVVVLLKKRADYLCNSFVFSNLEV